MSENEIADIGSTDTGASGGGDELESLLAQFDADTSRPADATGDAPARDASTVWTEPGPDGLTLDDILIRSERATLADAREQLENDYQKTLLQFQQAAHERDIPVAVKEIRGDLDNKIFSDDFVQTWMDNKARGSAALQQAWLNRAQDPQTWRAAQRQLGREFNSTFAKMVIDANVTEDREAVTAAVRGASANAPSDPPVRYGQLTNDEFRKEVRDKHGFDPGV